MSTFLSTVRNAPQTVRIYRRMDAADFARERLGLNLEPSQEALLRSTAKRVILNCSRQWGKSTIAAVRGLERAVTIAGSLVLVASPSDRQSAEFLDKTKELVSHAGIRWRGDGNNRRSLLFPNGSRIVGLPGREDTGRGFSNVSMVVIDEAARVDDAVYKMLRPTLAVSQGDLWLMSTPLGKRGFFYKVWEHGGPEWLRVRGPASDCPRISKKLLEKEREDEGDAYVRQEYMCEFVDNVSGAFDRDLVERQLDDEVLPLNLENRLSTWKTRNQHLTTNADAKVSLFR